VRHKHLVTDLYLFSLRGGISMLWCKYLLAAVVGLMTFWPSVSEGAILFIDDDYGLGGQTTWLKAISANGSPTANLANYDLVIWSIGDRDTNNLTAANVTALTNYLNGGGNLLYAGGHSVYYEAYAGSFITNYLGLSNYTYNMPYVNAPSSFTSTAHAAAGTGTHGLVDWAGGAYGDMMSGFSVLSGTTGLYTHGSDPYIGAIHETGTYKAMTWGFDLNQVVAGERLEILGAAVNYLDPVASVPEPTSLVVWGGLGIAGFVMARRRKKRAA
jgi:hypothetical protein